MDGQRIWPVQQQTSPLISRKECRRSSSPFPVEGRQRQAHHPDYSCNIRSSDRSFRSEQISNPRLDEPSKPEQKWSCPECGHPCWLCQQPATPPPEPPESRIVEDLEQSSMASGALSATIETPQTASSGKERKKEKFIPLGLTLVGPREQAFRDQILDPIGVYWADSPEERCGPPQLLGRQLIPDSNVIIRGEEQNLKRIATDFKEYKRRLYDEHALVMICCDSIILRDNWLRNDLGASQDDQEPVIASVRRDKWKPNKSGPKLPDSGFYYDWDLEPDTTYAVSVKMFDLEYRRKLHADPFQCWVAEKDVSICPYLTVEFKSSEKGGKESHATNQAVSAAILWLHQRKDLRNTIGQDPNDLRHFIIVLIDSKYLISEVQVHNDKYIIRPQVTGDLTLIDELRLYIEWSNAIHAYGLGDNALSFKKDIEKFVELS